ncbi:DVUA0089 family protein [Aliiglaciecola litoralis]|uniref:Ice-binding protein C-terminal domain-containing protein n=1 Tax=Aliiglaciecola litoralis TaxID=582857 RepID=A0ABN1LSJ5_9ALTE
MFKKLLLGTLFLCCFGSANAALISFDGNIAFHNDVVTIEFTLLNDATDVRVWTDSHMGGVNFDPIAALWTAAGDLIDESDDDDTIDPGSQTFYDAGFLLPTLAAGDYLFTVATYPNFANGDTLAQGFALDGETPIAMADWCQPANDCNEGTFWSVQLDGVDSANIPNDIPAPATILLMGLGLVGLLRRRK